MVVAARVAAAVLAAQVVRVDPAVQVAQAGVLALADQGDQAVHAVKVAQAVLVAQAVTEAAEAAVEAVLVGMVPAFALILIVQSYM